MSKEKEVIEQAVKLSTVGDFPTAIDLLLKIGAPESPGEVNYYLGFWYYKMGEMEKGRQFFQLSIQDSTSPFAYRSLHNLASICKRHSDLNEQVNGFKLLENALGMTIEQELPDEQEQTLSKMARYLLELDLYDSLGITETGLDWKEFNNKLPSFDRSSIPFKNGLTSVLTGLFCGYYLQSINKMVYHFANAIQMFESEPQMIVFIANLQQSIFIRAPVSPPDDFPTMKPTQEKDDLTRLIKVGAALNSELDLDKLLELVVDNIIEITTAERGFLMLAENNDLQFRIARDNKNTPLTQANFMISHTITKAVFETGNPILIADVEDGSSWILTQSVLDLHLKSMLCVPLKTSDKIIGLIYVDNSIQSSRFGQRELDLLTTLAGQTTIAIENARMYGHLEELVDERTADLSQANVELERMARTDPLTRLPNRRDFMEKMGHEVAVAERNGRTFVLVIADIDKFKQCNDTFGHDCGDSILVSVSTLLKKSIRKQDYVGRWGGEEFILMFPDTDWAGGEKVANKVRKKIEDYTFDYNGTSIKITMTFGVCVFDKSHGVDECLKRADEALYRGKEAGRNRVVLANE